MQCNGTIATFGPEIIKLVLQKQPADVICSEIELCNSSAAVFTKPAPPVKVAVGNGSLECTACEVCYYFSLKMFSILINVLSSWWNLPSNTLLRTRRRVRSSLSWMTFALHSTSPTWSKPYALFPIFGCSHLYIYIVQECSGWIWTYHYSIFDQRGTSRCNMHRN